MILTRRKFSIEDKLKILKEAAEGGVTAILNRYNLSYSVYVKWKQKLNNIELQGQGHQNLAHIQQHLRSLQEENNLLKKIIADRALQLSMKEEELRMIVSV
ncbi:MAG: transposase [Filimonas sp.]|nr:transposase [Filimonas sp.]